MSVIPQPDEFVVTVKDESVPRSEVIELLLKLNSRNLTAKDLISERVRAECDDRLLDRAGKQAPRLITPNEKEQMLNSPAAKHAIDPEKFVTQALAAFEANGFILLVDDRQVEGLEEEVEIREETIVTFLKLTPLVGG
ncbi:hypothetical protein [Roseovarius sp. 2305UL8-3]|uniref:hypothetical protein n=1 Tax=Roseovarius conchicola TaxID=3121636 RepID=UPI003528F9F9